MSTPQPGTCEESFGVCSIASLPYDLADGGIRTGFMQSSSLAEKIRYASDTSSKGTRWVIIAFGFKTPLCTCSMSRGNSLLTEAWFARMVRPLFTTFPIGTWVPTGPYTPTMETMPPFFTELIDPCTARADPPSPHGLPP